MMPFSPTDKPSKSARKRESHALQKLGEALIDLPEGRLVALPLPDKLREAVMAARGMSKHRALYRQRQYIGRLMRETDADAIRAALAADEASRQLAARRFHHVENWRNRLVDEGESLIGELLEEFPEADRQHVRQLIREAQNEQARGATPVHARQLFRYLQSLAPVQDDGTA